MTKCVTCGDGHPNLGPYLFAAPLNWTAEAREAGFAPVVENRQSLWHWIWQALRLDLPQTSPPPQMRVQVREQL